MRDKLLIFGKIELAVKNTAVYSADSLDLNTPAVQHTGRIGNVVVKFRVDDDFESVDSFIPIIMESADNSTYTELMRGPQIDKPAAGDFITLPMPNTHKRYLKAGAVPISSGTFTASEVTAWIELGA